MSWQSKSFETFFNFSYSKEFKSLKLVSYMSTEIDLHGLRLEEAESVVMRFVDQLYFQGETDGRIIHGMGVIAEKLPQWLKSYPYVKKFERLSYNPGVTLVFLEVR
jgi:dsDNA-specific endonuclease/ATPase MutS2